MTTTITTAATSDQFDLRSTIREARGGDARAVEALIRRFEKLVWWRVRSFRFADADACDAVQNTWLRMLEHLGELRDPDRAGAWLSAIAYRECLRLLRSGKREVIGLELTDDRPDERNPDPQDAFEDPSMRETLWRHVNELPKSARTVMVALSAHDAPHYADVARRSGIPIGSIGPTRMRSLQKLRNRLETEGLGAQAWR